MSDPIRLDKRLVELLGCSRGNAQKYIEGGWVQVDGEMVDLPQFKVAQQKVELHPDATLEPITPVTMLLNLPDPFAVKSPEAGLGLITPESRSEDDHSRVRILNRHFSGLKPTAPLEAKATGLVAFTNDWRVVRRLVEDANRNEQEYVVELSDVVSDAQIEQLNRPMKMGGAPLMRSKVSRQSEARLRFALKAPRAGQIQFMCESVGLSVATMKRIRIGSISMGKLPPGQWRYLPSGKLF